MNYTKLTLGELLSSDNEIIKRNATIILKISQKLNGCIFSCDTCGATQTSGKYCTTCEKLNN